MMGKKERTAAPFLWGLGPPNKQKREDAASGRSSVFRKSYILFHCLPPLPKGSRPFYIIQLDLFEMTKYNNYKEL